MGVRNDNSDKMLAVAKSLLSGVLEYSVCFGEPELLTKPGRRNSVWRLRIETGSTGGPESVLVKQRSADLYDPGRPGAPGTRELLNEWAALEFLDEVFGEEEPIAPRFIAGDQAHGLLILEDLGGLRTNVLVGGRLRHESPSLVQPLLEADRAGAEEGLVQMMRTLGRLHARTAVNLGRFRELRRKLDPANDDVAERSVRLRFLTDVISFVRGSGVSLRSGFDAEVASLIEALGEPGSFRSLGHGDPCPDNWLDLGGELRLIDFEFAGPQSALLDACYPRMAFPTCWCCGHLPAQLVRSLELAYRKEASEGLPEITDDSLYARALTDAVVFWTLHALRWAPIVTNEDRVWGTASTRARILFRLAALETMPDAEEAYPALVQALKQLLSQLLKAWGEEMIPAFPALGGAPS